MHKKWSKEDRNSFNKSEVMRELETIVLDTVKRADILISKNAQDKDPGAAAQEMKAYTEAVKGATEAAKEFSEATGMADDGAGDEIADQDFVDDVTDPDLTSEVVDDLRSLAKAAILEGNVKLAYRIERTIDEIMETAVSCE